MKKETGKTPILTLILIGSLFVAAQNQLIPASIAHSGDALSAWAKTTPTIDGSLGLFGIKLAPYPEPPGPSPGPGPGPDTPYPSALYPYAPFSSLPHPPGPRFIVTPGEWDDAYKQDFSLTYSGNSHPATLWVKNDYINLYLAVRITNTFIVVGDRLVLDFDNNNDGAMEAGDNELCLWGAQDQFFDRYFKADGSTTLDTLDGGTSDGAGFADHKVASQWVFEIVYPLRSGDSAHDFSLFVGNRVGFMLGFVQGGEAAYWPAGSSTDWAKMADIEIAGPPTPLPDSNVDLAITGVEVSQAVQTGSNTLSLVKGKATIVRVSVSAVVAADAVMDVFLYGVDSSGVSLGALRESCEIHYHSSRESAPSTANFELPLSWVESDSLTLKAFVKETLVRGIGTVREANFDNNWMMIDGKPEMTAKFWPTATLTVHIIPVSLDGSLPTSFDIRSQETTVKAMYPAADINFIEHWELTSPEYTANTLIQKGLKALKPALERYAIELGVKFPDQVVGFLPYSFSVAHATQEKGLAFPKDPWSSGLVSAVMATTPYDTTMAHELDHNLGPYDGTRGWGGHTPSVAGVPDGDWPYEELYSINEYAILTTWGGSVLTLTGRCSGSDGFQVLYPAFPEVMSYSPNSCWPYSWISPYRWQHLFDLLHGYASFAGSGSEYQAFGASAMDNLEISGWVGKNGTGFLDPVFRLSREPLQLEAGNATVELQDALGNVLSATSFQPTFEDMNGVLYNESYFTMVLPYQNGTARVVLKSGNQTLATISETGHAPIVQILKPSGGEIWNTGFQTVRWIGNDTDGDSLTYKVLYSADNGTTWTPVSAGLHQPSCQVNTSHIKAGNQSRIKVIATDGFNNAQTISRPIAVLNHPPTAEIIEPANMTAIAAIDSSPEVTLVGTGADPDETLPESAFEWFASSSVEPSGLSLGHGRRLTAPLGLWGNVAITLRVTDSHGVSGSHTHVIFVDTPAAFYYEFPTPSLYNQTAVGQGYTAKIKVQINNPASFVRSFNVTAFANGQAFQSMSIPELGSNSSTPLEFLWNTAGKPKGVYNITATITTPEYEIIQLLNTIRIAMVGDITGPTAKVPDGRVDIRDIATTAKIFGAFYPDARYDPNCDITGPMIGVPDGKIDIRDIATIAKRFGQVDP